MNNTFTQAHPGKRRFAAKLRGLAMLLGGLVLTAGNTFAEGTKEISNNDANTNSALLVYQSRGSGPYLTNIPETGLESVLRILLMNVFIMGLNGGTIIHHKELPVVLRLVPTYGCGFMIRLVPR